MPGVFREHVSLADYTTFKTGGAAEYFVSVTTPEELKAAVDFARAKQLPFFVLGGGTNVLASDTGYHGVVIHIQLRGVIFTDVSLTLVEVTAGAGESFDELVAATVTQNLWGLENLSAIPGTVGATPVQNVGAYGVEVADTIVRVCVLNHTTLGIEELATTACQFQYRDSIFKQKKGREYTILSVTFLLSRLPQPQVAYADLAVLADADELTPEMVRSAVTAIRSGKFPDWHTVGTAGSFFKNPSITHEEATKLQQQFPALPLYPTESTLVKVSLGYILDKICHLRGYAKNHVALYEKQALVLVAESGATTTEILAFAREVSERVHSATQIQIEREVNLLE